MRRLRYKLLIILLSVKWMFRINLFNFVRYKGKKYLVINGVRKNSWKLSELKNDNDGWVLRKECRKVLTISNIIGSFQSGYLFYMVSWYEIWVHKGIEPWMKNCNIW